MAILKENMSHHYVEHESVNHTHNKQLVRANGAIEELVQALQNVQCSIKSDMLYAIFCQLK